MSIYTDRGTASHWVLEQCLISIYVWGLATRASEYVGQNVTIQDYEHEELSPSSADRWMKCSGSVLMSRPFREPVDSTPRAVPFTTEDAQAVQEVLDYVEERVATLQKAFEAPVIVHTERKVSPEPYLGTHACDGTVDITLICNQFAEIIDAKFGAGVPVMPDTKQLDFYLLGTLAGETHQILQTARLTIAQPRCSKVSPTIRWRKINDVGQWRLQFVEQAKKAIAATKEEPPTFTAGEKTCRWCSARSVCATAAQHSLQAVGIDVSGSETLYEQFESFALIEPHLLTPERIRSILDGAEILQATLQAVKAFALKAILAGRASDEITSAYKVVLKSSRRRWAQDEAETEKRLKRIKFEDAQTGKKRGLGKKELTENKLKGPAAVEKLLKAVGIPPKDARFDAFRALIDKPEGVPALVPISDTRPAVQSERSPEQALGNGPDMEAPVFRDPFDHDEDDEVETLP